jgi:hypothetical protein
MASLPYPRSLLAAIFSHRFHRSAQNLLVEKGLPQISQIYTDVGGYGILAIPTQPSYCDFLPQISQICTEPSYCDFLPQNSQNSQNLLTVISSHRFHRFAQNLLAVIFSHRFHRSAQKLLVEKGLPQIARIYTDVGGYGIPAVPTQPTICVDQCNPWENCIPTERRIHRIPNTHHL